MTIMDNDDDDDENGRWIENGNENEK